MRKRKEKEDYYKFQPPTKGYREKCYSHEMQADKGGYVNLALVNKLRGFGIYMKYLRRQLPQFTQWKMMGQGIYVCGLEPGNCGVLGRAKEREAGTMQFLNPGETKEIELEIRVLTNQQQIKQIERKIKLV